MNNQKGFTLIELIVVIVILGILSAVAVPKFIDLKSDAELSSVNGVYGGVKSAASINHAGVVLGKTGYVVIDTVQKLVDAMDGGVPEGWTIDDTGAVGAGAADSTIGLCYGGTTTADSDYVIFLETAETTSATAVLRKDW